MVKDWGIHWFRRDLRICGNPALRWNWGKTKGCVLGFFCFDPLFLGRGDFSINRFAFFLKTLQALKEDLQANGGDLLILDEGPKKAFPLLLAKLQELDKKLPRWITWNRDYEPFSRSRDEWVTTYLNHHQGIQTHTERDHLLIEPEELQNQSSKERNYYSVYTPFARKWSELFQAPAFLSRIEEQKKALRQWELRHSRADQAPLFQLTWNEVFGKNNCLPDVLQTYIQKTSAKVNVPIPEAGPKIALEQLHRFSKKMDSYLDQRDYPFKLGTSRLSIFLKNGSLTTSQMIAVLGLDQVSIQTKSGRSQYFKELIWREFYYHILWHQSEVEVEAFNPIYRKLDWPNREDWFTAWKAGLTGYPIVDAGMRELQQTGLMHNRLRMIVASFLTKDLLIDWRWGEKYFMEKLLDGDLAPNNGGWQWAASTGCDPQPYFRIFNPELQSRKFDPEGNYIRKFIPELAHLTNDCIHAPTSLQRRGKYPDPLVMHQEQKVKALALYKSSQGKSK